MQSSRTVFVTKSPFYALSVYVGCMSVRRVGIADFPVLDVVKHVGLVSLDRSVDRDRLLSVMDGDLARLHDSLQALTPGYLIRVRRGVYIPRGRMGQVQLSELIAAIHSDSSQVHLTGPLAFLDAGLASIDDMDRPVIHLCASERYRPWKIRAGVLAGVPDDITIEVRYLACHNELHAVAPDDVAAAVDTIEHRDIQRFHPQWAGQLRAYLSTRGWNPLHAPSRCNTARRLELLLHQELDMHPGWELGASRTRILLDPSGEDDGPQIAPWNITQNA